MYDGNTVTQLTNNSYGDSDPRIYGSNVVWVAKPWTRFQIFFYDGHSITQLTEYHGEIPEIYGSNVVWEGWDGSDHEIFFYDGNTVIQLTDNTYLDTQPQVHGSNIVWQGRTRSPYYDVFFYDGNTVTQLTDSGYGGQLPQVYGSNVVWVASDGNDSEIFFYDGNTVTQLTNNSYGDSDPQIYGSNVVWEGWDGTDSEIFLATPAPPPIEAEVQIKPNVLNLRSKGKWITCHIWLPEGYDVADVNSDSVFLEDQIPADWIWFDEEQQVVMAKFSRSALRDLLSDLETPTTVELLVSGQLNDGTPFEG
ncbi:MAG: TolB-like translocation protein, partial [Planctomycetota bacterium]